VVHRPLHGVWEVGQQDPDSFYARFATSTPPAPPGSRRKCGPRVNRPNLREHIAPLREAADIVVTKAADHSIVSIVRERPDGEEFG